MAPKKQTKNFIPQRTKHVRPTEHKPLPAEPNPHAPLEPPGPWEEPEAPKSPEEMDYLSGKRKRPPMPKE